MALDNRSIVITLKSESEIGGSSPSQDLNVSNKTSSSEAQSKSNNNSMAKAAYAQMAISAANAVVNEMIAWGDYDVDKYMNLHDDYIGQRNMNVAQHYINGAVSAGSTIVSMALVGSAAGPMGAAVGAAIGTVIAAARIERSNIQGNDQQEIQIKQLDCQLQYTRRRAGWSLTAASIGEDL